MRKIHNIADSPRFGEQPFEPLSFSKDGIILSGVDAGASVESERRYELMITSPNSDEEQILNFNTAAELRQAFELAKRLAVADQSADQIRTQLLDKLYPNDLP